MDVTLTIPAAVTVSTTGVQGPPGNGVRHGTGPPDASLGNDGDYYIDGANPSAPVFYGPKTSGAWGGGVPLGGGSGASYYLHTQSSPAATWQVHHGLGRTPNVAVISTGGTVVHADIVHASNNLAVITFPTAYAGTAMCS
ncbi:hypothetical protein ABZX65_26680 [Streptomyces sp. NPDC003300]|uniref:hypothetical protein n=1 Tax=unclassified Streptomyces TaxID=2593676 RepID=UPI0033B42BF6